MQRRNSLQECFLNIVLYFISGLRGILLLLRQRHRDVCTQGSKSAYQGLVQLLTTQTIRACLKTDEYDYENLGCKTLESTLKQA